MAPLIESLLQETTPGSARLGGKTPALLAFLMGLGFAALYYSGGEETSVLGNVPLDLASDPQGYGQDPYGGYGGQDPYGQDPYGGGQSPFGGGDQNPFGGGGQNPFGSNFNMSNLRKMLKQYQDAAAKTQKEEEKFQHELQDVQNQLTWDVLRPIMKTSWQCKADCADPSKSNATDFQECQAKCDDSLQEKQNEVSQYLQQIQSMQQQCSESCQQQVGRNGTQMDIADCTVKCTKDIETKIPTFKTQIEGFLKRAQAS